MKTKDTFLFIIKFILIFIIVVSFNLLIKAIFHKVIIISNMEIDFLLFIPQIALGFLLCKLFKL